MKKRHVAAPFFLVRILLANLVPPALRTPPAVLTLCFFFFFLFFFFLFVFFFFLFRLLVTGATAETKLYSYQSPPPSLFEGIHDYYHDDHYEHERRGTRVLR
jgi:hypothetical protein